MHAMFRTVTAILLLISSTAIAWADTSAADPGVPTLSCTAPKGLLPIVTGPLPPDAYVDRAVASSEGDYVRAFYQLNGRVELEGDHLTTSDPDAATICEKIAGGDASPELNTAFETAVAQGKYWWPAKWTTQALGGTDFHSDEQTENVVYLSAKYVSFVTEEA